MMKNLKQHLCCLFACAAVFLSGMPQCAASGIVVYDNGAPDQQSGNNMGFAVQAEDFLLGAATTLTDVRFWSLETADAYRGSISWAIMTNDCGRPCTAIASGTEGSVSRSATGVQDAFGLTEYLNGFNLDAPLALGPGTYWLVLHNGSFSDMGDPNEFLWESTSIGPANSAGGRGAEWYDQATDWTSNFAEHAFQISAVPEPAAVLMLLAGMLVLACLRRREPRCDTFNQ